ncbi:uncharacterized protein TNIN_368331 [Trichonephila inaurata madagascariensis]|uniref:Uncharacterized protein n=1 Tax=Trichonephila inaurata madagascariensis TaxID=2747483 RepID=A0A8X6J7K4_9ARAC|nr:uncharacterized protein TNIN_368331 [Trichonephila inaurata madagascariensis]
MTSVFVIYYSLICRVIRLLFGHLLDRFHRHPQLTEECRNLLESCGEITKSMRKIGEDLSFPTFAAVIVSMGGLLWAGYKIAFRKYVTDNYFVSQVCTISGCLTFQLLIMIPACMTNEMEIKARNTVKYYLKCKISHVLRETKFKEVDPKESNLTLWKIYVLDRSLLITSFGTLLTCGILIGTLGEES